MRPLCRIRHGGNPEIARERVPIFREMPFAFQKNRNESETTSYPLSQSDKESGKSKNLRFLAEVWGLEPCAPLCGIQHGGNRKPQGAHARLRSRRVCRRQRTAPLCGFSRIGVPQRLPAFPKIGEEKMNLLVESLKALLFGIVEGITSGCPSALRDILILLDEFIQLQMSDAF